MKRDVARTSLCAALVLCICGIALAHQGPVPNFRLPNDELFVVFGGNDTGPYFQYVDYRLKQFQPGALIPQYDASDLFGSGNHKIVFGEWSLIPPIDACAVDFDGPDTTDAPGAVVAYTSADGDKPFVVVEKQSYKRESLETKQLGISDLLNEDEAHPRVCVGYFTEEALAASRPQLVVGTGRRTGPYFAGTWYWIGHRGLTAYWEPPLSGPKFARVWERDTPWLYNDLAAVDFDGDGVDELVIAVAEPIGGGMDWWKGEVWTWNWEEGEAFTTTPSQRSKVLQETWTGAEGIALGGGDIDADGLDELVIVIPQDDKLKAIVMDYDPGSGDWTQRTYSTGLLSGSYSLARNERYDKLQVVVADVDYNGLDDIAVSLSTRVRGQDRLYFWLYTFDRTGPTERLNSYVEEDKPWGTMAVSNVISDSLCKLYFLTGGGKLYAAEVHGTFGYDVSEVAARLNTVAHGFRYPAICSTDLDRDSYWCRLDTGKVDSVSITRQVGKPVAILTSPPYHEGVNDTTTSYNIVYKHAADTLCAVQEHSGWGYSLNVDAQVNYVVSKVRTTFERSFSERVLKESAYRKGVYHEGTWNFRSKFTNVVYMRMDYVLYPYRIEYEDGEPVIGEDGSQMWLYIVVPHQPQLESDTWETYLLRYEDTYGTEARNELEEFMEPFMRYTPGNVESYLNNEAPISPSLGYNLAFPEWDQEIDAGMESCQRTWGSTEFNSRNRERSRKWYTEINVYGDASWGFAEVHSHFRLYFYTHVKEKEETTQEDYTQITVKYGGIPDESYTYDTENYVFWAPENSCIPGALILSYRVTGTGVRVAEKVPELPLKYALSRNFPNPFNECTTIEYQVPHSTWVRIEIYDLVGKKVGTLVNKHETAGRYTCKWNGLDEEGKSAPSGVYFCRMKSGSFSDVKKITLLR